MLHVRIEAFGGNIPSSHRIEGNVIRLITPVYANSPPPTQELSSTQTNMEGSQSTQDNISSSSRERTESATGVFSSPVIQRHSSSSSDCSSSNTSFLEDGQQSIDSLAPGLRNSDPAATLRRSVDNEYNELVFYAGNPAVESIKGKLHLFKNSRNPVIYNENNELVEDLSWIPSSVDTLPVCIFIYTSVLPLVTITNFLIKTSLGTTK